MNEMKVSEKVVRTVNTFFNGVTGTAVRTGRRAFIKQLLNRQTAYRLSDYTRKLRKATGLDITATEILSSLTRMSREGQIRYEVVDGKVYGYDL